jgi:hypothetical protein
LAFVADLQCSKIKVKDRRPKTKDLFPGSAIQEEFVIPYISIVTVESGKGIGGLFEHLLRHCYGIAELLEIE